MSTLTTIPAMAPMLRLPLLGGSGIEEAYDFAAAVTVVTRVRCVLVDVVLVAAALLVPDVIAGMLPPRGGGSVFPFNALTADRYCEGVTPVRPVIVKRSE